MRTILERHFWLCVGLIVAFLAIVQVTSISQESQTYDEAAHLAAGYSYWTKGSFALNPEHPPLAKLLAALPLLPLQPRFPDDMPNWETRQYDVGAAFLYANRIPADVLLFAGRMPSVILTLCLALVLAAWTASRFGRLAGLSALVLIAFDPTVIAHGRYITTDISVTLLGFCACILWGRYLESRRRGLLCAAAVVLGLTLLSKFSAIVFLPVFVALYFIRWWQRSEGTAPDGPELRFSIRHFALALVSVGAVALGVIYAGYGFETETLLSQPLVRQRFEHSLGDLKTKMPTALAGFADASKPQGRIVLSAVGRLPIPARSYFYGLYRTLRDSRIGRGTFVAGHLRSSGVWYYFPFAFSIKEPIGTLIFLGLVLIMVLQNALRQRLRDLTRWLRRAEFSWYILAVPCLFFGLAAIETPVNIGIRHILPVYPFLFAFMGASLSNETSFARSRWVRLARVGCLVLLMLESVAAYPYYLPFFNLAIGGGANGFRYLGDSNLDWGQEVKRLRLYQDAHPDISLCIGYWGTADLNYYGIRASRLPTTTEPDAQRRCDCVAAVSAALFSSVNREYSWLNFDRPFARIGNAMWLLDLRKQHGNARRTAR